jgi:hypothetical protein
MTKQDKSLTLQQLSTRDLLQYATREASKHFEREGLGRHLYKYEGVTSIIIRMVRAVHHAISGNAPAKIHEILSTAGNSKENGFGSCCVSAVLPYDHVPSVLPGFSTCPSAGCGPNERTAGSSSAVLFCFFFFLVSATQDCWSFTDEIRFVGW